MVRDYGQQGDDEAVSAMVPDQVSNTATKLY
jgi:hypothetical protein